jgi:hypothetical protein
LSCRHIGRGPAKGSVDCCPIPAACHVGSSPPPFVSSPVGCQYSIRIRRASANPLRDRRMLCSPLPSGMLHYIEGLLPKSSPTRDPDSQGWEKRGRIRFGAGVRQQSLRIVCCRSTVGDSVEHLTPSNRVAASCRACISEARVTLCLRGRGLGSHPDTDVILAPHSS